MLTKLRKHIILRLFCGLLSLHIFNCSVDMPDAAPQNVAENLSYNDMESFVELLLEYVLGFENAVSEYDDADNEDGTSFEIKNSLDIFTLPNFQISAVIFSPTSSPNNDFISSYKDACDQFFYTPNSPPPQV